MKKVVHTLSFHGIEDLTRSFKKIHDIHVANHKKTVERLNELNIPFTEGKEGSVIAVDINNIPDVKDFMDFLAEGRKDVDKVYSE